VPCAMSMGNCWIWGSGVKGSEAMLSCVLTEYMCHVYVRSDSLSAVLVSDQEYPQRVAFSLLNKVSRNILFGLVVLFVQIILILIVEVSTANAVISVGSESVTFRSLDWNFIRIRAHGWSARNCRSWYSTPLFSCTRGS